MGTIRSNIAPNIERNAGTSSVVRIMQNCPAVINISRRSPSELRDDTYLGIGTGKGGPRRATDPHCGHQLRSQKRVSKKTGIRLGMQRNSRRLDSGSVAVNCIQDLVAASLDGGNVKVEHP
tara:strand:+ start:2920 stop:3282 length:363 start_codon:yes stop_codon:yes gene_type:complete